MSSWQSFFNQLNKVQSDVETKTICRCQIGSIISASNEYRFTGACNMGNICASIQIDKHKSVYKGEFFIEKPSFDKSELINKDVERLDSIEKVFGL